jgi:hypothetical protein
MSKKLLEESTIRSFMKLANLQPLTAKFLKEAEKAEGEEEEDEEEEDEEEGQMKESAPPDTEETAHSRDRLEEEKEEEKVEEGKESEGRPASPKHKVKGVAKPAKMDAAKNAAGDAKLKPMKQTHVHSDKPDSIEAKHHSNAPKKNNSTFEVMSEALEEEMHEMEDEAAEAPEMGGAEMGSAGETGEHKEKMKELIRSMLTNLSDMGKEYGLQMDISDEGGAGEEAPEAPEAEMAPPEGEAAEEDEGAAMQEKLDEMVEKLTKRVAARLVKETKKKR